MRTVLKCLSVGILLLFFSCKNEEALPLLNPESEMCEIRFSGSAFDFQWNGKALGVKDAWAYPVVEFDAIESDTTKLQLTISSLLPDDIKLAVDVVPGVSEIVFSGKSSGKPYDLEVEGYFMPQEEEKKLSITCRYQMNESCIELDTPYDFHFGEDCLSLIVGGPGEVEWNGQVWKKTDLVKDVLRKMGQRVAQRTEMMRVIFHADATLDVFVREVGEENFVQIATLQYDISSMIPNRMNWIFTQEQSRCVETELIGEPLPCSIFFTDFFNDGRDFLPMYFARGDNSGSLYLNIASPYRQRAISRYIRSKGAEGLPEEEVEEMELFFQIIQEDGAWEDNTWLYLLRTEKR